MQSDNALQARGSTIDKQVAFYDLLVLGGRRKRPLTEDEKNKKKKESRSRGKQLKPSKGFIQSEEKKSRRKALALDAIDQGMDVSNGVGARRDTDVHGEDSMVTQHAESKQEHAHAAVPSLLEDGHLFGSTWESLPDVFPIYNDHFEWSVDDDLKSLAGHSDGDSHSEMDDDFDLGLDLTAAEEDGDDGHCSASLQLSEDIWSWEKGGGEDKPPTSLEEMFRSRSPLKPKVRTRRPPRSIANVQRSTRLEWNDISRLPEKWPWSMHWGLTNMSDEDMLVNRISELDIWALANEIDGVLECSAGP